MITPHTPRHDAAQIYTSRGWRVFVLSPTKAPLRNCPPCHTEHTTPEQMEACTCLTCHGFYAATTDTDRIDAMLTRHPDGLLAIRTGAVSGIAVIDVDPPEGLATMRQLTAEGLLPETCAQHTGSGGWHLFYQHPGGRLMSGAGKVGPKVDSKADGGYVVAAPSTHPRTGRAYRWRHDWASAPLDALHPEIARRLQPPAPPPRKLDPRAFDHLSHTRLRGLVNTVLTSPKGGRNAALHWASCKAGEMVARGEITTQLAYDALAEAATQIGLPVSEIGADPHRGTIGSGLRAGCR